ncbi:unnamed protein product [Bemisia tabaci]|uniref:Ionotropic receptor n=1 Tax=Bemisia tabaci TaxID=7038 RepID=A0A9P0ALB4_BEMTA|nr:unnamed protein product [Bemisia tabaci]
MGDGKCDEHMFISSAELDGSAYLSDLNFNMTRGLYESPIWNSNTYLIFMLSKPGRNTYNFNTCVYPQVRPRALSSDNKTPPEDFDALVFCFKFIWRFYHGLKTVICNNKSCSRYDPFAENIIQYNGEDNETYFDFFVNNLNGKTLNIITDGQDNDVGNEADGERFRIDLKLEIFKELEVSLNCTFVSFIWVFNHEDAQKFNVHLHEPRRLASSEEVDLSRFDFSIGVEMEAMCIITPHSELMPQCLVPFEVFTTPVWIFILVTAAVFVLIQRVFLKAQSGFFLSLYSEEEISPYITASSVYMIYTYFICGFPPRLLLGKLFTGKVLFFLFIFSAFIISNVFLGGVTTLLANTVQYPEIDTLKDLEDSDLVIQVPSVESAAIFFAQLDLSEKLSAKLSSDVANIFAAEDGYVNITWIRRQFRWIARFTVAKEFARNLHVALENDAFLVALPHSLRSETRVVVTWWPLQENIEYHVVKEFKRTNNKTGCHKKNSFPRYCVTVDGYPMVATKCDEHMFISSAELNGSADLSDLNFNMTRGLYTSPIWNSNNYLIFMLSKPGRNTYHLDTCVYPQEWPHVLSSQNITSPEEFDALVFCFKFIWRFYHGLKTTICNERGCSRYDPFVETIIRYNGEDNETYFDFTVNNLNGKTLNIIADDQYHNIANEADGQGFREAIEVEIFHELEISLNCTFQYILFLIDNEDGQKYNVHLNQPRLFLSSEEVDLSRFDFSIGVEMEAMCIITPHSELMPRCLVPFKVFTSLVWILILVTAVLFVLMQRVFLKAQRGLFLGLYSEEELTSYSTASSVYMIYSYFICGSPPRLLLGKLFTGKVLFFVFMFSAFFISNVFLGGMTTLLATTVQYPEIDTLKDLEDSDLVIQVPSVDSAATYFARLGLSEKLIAKLSSAVDRIIVAESETWNVSLIMRQMIMYGHVIISKEFEKSMHVILENDAFLVELTHSLRSQTRIVVTRWPLQEKIEYHVVKECLRTYPFMFSFLKNSYLFRAFNEKTAQFLETGHHIPFSGRQNTLDVMDSAHPKDEGPRPYSLNDLQLPFLCLVVGLVLSFVVFSAEMVMEDFENALVFRKLRLFKNYLLSIKYIKR